MQDVQSLLQKTFSQVSHLNSSGSLTKSTPEERTTDKPKFDYWTWYFGKNSIREWNEAHGIKLIRSELSDTPCYVADPDKLFGDTPMASCYPDYFQNRTLDKFSTALYSFGVNRDKAQAAYNKVKKYIEGYAMVVAQYNGGGLYFYSRERGSGKTFLSTILGNELSKRGRRVRWYNMTNLLQEIKACYDRESATSSAEIINLCRNCEILILDDIGVEKQSSWVNETVYSILDFRMVQCKPTIFTSNHRPSELSYDERIIDRISRMTELVEMPEESIRKKLNAKSKLGSYLGGE